MQAATPVSGYSSRPRDPSSPDTFLSARNIRDEELTVIGRPTQKPHDTVSGKGAAYLAHLVKDSAPNAESIARTTNTFMNNYGLVIISIVAGFVVPGQRKGVLALGVGSGIAVRLLQSALPNYNPNPYEARNIAQDILAVLTKLELANNVDLGYAGTLAFGLKFFSTELPALITTFALAYHITAWAITRLQVNEATERDE